ncbi:MAG: hypothetical protein KY468_16645 [Armatimonadetes bacterium]|nr:hypothetical protein [Armatimonadota bacterium]
MPDPTTTPDAPQGNTPGEPQGSSTETPPSAETGTSIMADPCTTVQRLLDSPDEGRVRAIMRSLSPEQAAEIIRYAPSSKDKSRLLGSMERLQRAETLDHVAPTLFAMLVENPDTGTDYLLGEVSYERFRELLALCSPEQRFYWVSRAARHDDGAAQLLTLLLPPRDLAEMLLTVPDFRRNFTQLRQYEPDQFEEVPTKNPQLKVVLQFMADFDTEMYKAVFLAARNSLDWEHVNKEATEEFLQPQAIRDFEKYEAPDTDLESQESAAAPAEMDSEATEMSREEREEDAQVQNALAQRDFAALTTGGLTAERLQEIQEDLEAMIQREIVDAGGSFSPEALEQASGRVHAYLHYGLIRLGGGVHARMAQLLAERSMISVLHAGMEYIEAIRQRAIRIAHLRETFDKEQMILLEGLLHPRVGISPGKRTEYIFWLPSKAKKTEGRPAILIDEARDAIEELAGWAALAQWLPEGQVRRALHSSPSGAQAYLGALVVALALYRRWDPTLIDLQDVYDFHDRMVDTAAGDMTPAVKESLDTFAEKWARAQGLNEQESMRVGRALLGAGERLARWLVRYPRPKASQCKNWVYLGVGGR